MHCERREKELDSLDSRCANGFVHGRLAEGDRAANGGRSENRESEGEDGWEVRLEDAGGDLGCTGEVDERE